MKKVLFVALMAAAGAAQANQLGNALTQMGFTQTTQGVNNTVFASYERSMDFSTCNRFIGLIGQNLGRAPTNIVETSATRVVRFGNIDFGSMLLTCNGARAIINLSHNKG